MCHVLIDSETGNEIWQFMCFCSALFTYIFLPFIVSRLKNAKFLRRIVL